MALFILGGPFALAVIATPIAVAAAVTLDVTMYAINRPRARLSKEWHVRTDPLRPVWIRHTLRATGWGSRRVGWCLAAVLLADLVLIVCLGLLDR
ncbi:MAG: hypothetical protein M3P04_07480 [Actinomycetota bacterium]|nr:hypothetical protein [Actinomycetota bacterium]